MIIENTSLMQQDKYIFHLYVFSTCFGRDITHHQDLQNCTHSDMVMVPREVRRDVVEEIKWRLARQYYAGVGDVKRVERSLMSSCCIKLVFSIIIVWCTEPRNWNSLPMFEPQTYLMWSWCSECDRFSLCNLASKLWGEEGHSETAQSTMIWFILYLQFESVKFPKTLYSKVRESL